MSRLQLASFMTKRVDELVLLFVTDMDESLRVWLIRTNQTPNTKHSIEENLALKFESRRPSLFSNAKGMGLFLNRHK